MHWHIINHRDYIDGPYDTYEEALNEALFEEILLGQCRLPFTVEQVRAAVKANRFEARTGGRPFPVR